MSVDRIRIEVIFSAPIHIGPGVHSASYTMGSGLFPGVQRKGCGVNHPLQFSAEFKERVMLYLYSPTAPSLQFTGCTSPLLQGRSERSFMVKEKTVFIFQRDSPGHLNCFLRNACCTTQTHVTLLQTTYFRNHHSLVSIKSIIKYEDPVQHTLYELHFCIFTTLLHVSAKLYGHYRNPYKKSVT